MRTPLSLAALSWRRFAVGCVLACVQILVGVTSSSAEATPSPPFARRPLAGTVIGRVIEARTELPLASANVELEGLRIQTMTGVDGRYSLVNVPAGTHVLIARRIGYGTIRQTI